MSGVLVAALGGAAAGALCAPAALRARPGRRASHGAVQSSLPGPRGMHRGVLVMAALGALVAAALRATDPGPLPPAELVLALVVTFVAVVDVRVRRLPNAAVLPAAGLLVVLVALAHRQDPSGGSLVRSLATFAAVLVAATVLALVAPLRFGMGDARFLTLPVPVLAYAGPERLLAFFVALAAVSAALLAVVLRRPRTDLLVPFGPLVALSVVLVLLLDTPVAAGWREWVETTARWG